MVREEKAHISRTQKKRTTIGLGTETEITPHASRRRGIRDAREPEDHHESFSLPISHFPEGWEGGMGAGSRRRAWFLAFSVMFFFPFAANRG